jgi:hypothetical protein
MLGRCAHSCIIALRAPGILSTIRSAARKIFGLSSEEAMITWGDEAPVSATTGYHNGIAPATEGE